MSSNTEIHQIPVQFMFKQIYTKDSIVHLRKTVNWGGGGGIQQTPQFYQCSIEICMLPYTMYEQVCLRMNTYREILYTYRKTER